MDEGLCCLIAEKKIGLDIGLAVRKKRAFPVLLKERLPGLVQMRGDGGGGFCFSGFQLQFDFTYCSQLCHEDPRKKSNTRSQLTAFRWQTLC